MRYGTKGHMRTNTRRNMVYIFGMTTRMRMHTTTHRTRLRRRRQRRRVKRPTLQRRRQRPRGQQTMRMRKMNIRRSTTGIDHPQGNVTQHANGNTIQMTHTLSRTIRVPMGTSLLTIGVTNVIRGAAIGRMRKWGRSNHHRNTRPRHLPRFFVTLPT